MKDFPDAGCVLPLDETAKALTDYGAESTHAQVAVHCLRHGSKQVSIMLRDGAKALLAPHVIPEEDEVYCFIRLETEAKSA